MRQSITDPIENIQYIDPDELDGPLYYALDKKNPEQFAKAMGSCLGGAGKSGSIKNRVGMTKRDYSDQRSAEAVPTTWPEIFQGCDGLYNRIGLVKHMIDLMSDFCTGGVSIAHPIPAQEVFFQHWFNIVKGPERSERIANYLYRLGNVGIRKMYATITKDDTEEIKKAIAELKTEVRIPVEKIVRTKIPAKYVFIEPGSLEVVGGELSSFLGERQYRVKISKGLQNDWTTFKKGSDVREIAKNLPEDIKESLETGRNVPLDSDRFTMLHYKKDDWKLFAYPITYSIYDDLLLLEKLKLADSSALDGAITNLKIIKLGSLEHQIMPSQGAFRRVAEMIQANAGGGNGFIVWGPDIDMLESKTEIHKFLGLEKYKPTLQNIYSGFGVPPSLSGAFETSGTTNNYMSLQALVEKLHYARNIVTGFWDQELRYVQKAMGFAKPPQVIYKFINLGDVAAVWNLVISLCDRNLISEKAVVETFGFNKKIEDGRIHHEEKLRKAKKKSVKMGPFSSVSPDHELRKIFSNAGLLTPSEVDLELKPKKPGQKSVIETGHNFQRETQQRALKSQKETPSIKFPLTTAPSQKTEDNEPTSPGGRPANKKDSQKRKTKNFSPQSKASQTDGD